MAPPTQADLLRAAVETRLPPAELGEQLALHAWTRLSH
jgi:hypothetical protein